MNTVRSAPNLKLQWALSYAKRGWKVLPLHAPVKGGCSCGQLDCSSIGKHPRTPNGYKDAKTDPDTAEITWEATRMCQAFTLPACKRTREAKQEIGLMRSY